MALTNDEIFYNALLADADIVAATGSRIKSTSIEVAPTDDDNTPLPYLVVMFDGMVNDQSTKDGFEGDHDNVSISIEVNADSRSAVGILAQKVREAVRSYFETVDEESDDYHLLPEDYQLSATAVAWDWTKPCYHQTLSYNCSTINL